MNDFTKKIIRLKVKLSFLESRPKVDNIRIYNLKKKLEIYEKVDEMSHKEVGEQLSYSAGEIEKLKSGYYNKKKVVDYENKLLVVLRERIKADKKEQLENLKIKNDSLDKSKISDEIIL